MAVDIRRALVTGASSGIGETYADRLARRGSDLVLVARNADRLAGVAERLRRDHGRSVDILAADLSEEAGCRAVEERLLGDTAIDALVNNAGIAITTPFLDTPTDAVDGLVRLNVVAATRLVSAAARGFAARGRGTIISIGSIAAFSGGMLNASYGASKAFLVTLTEWLAPELAARGVRMQAVCPGITLTDIWTKSGIDPASLPPEAAMPVGDMVDAALAGLDLGELVTLPSLPDAADLAAFHAARSALRPNLSRAVPAARYRSQAALSAE